MNVSKRIEFIGEELARVDMVIQLLEVKEDAARANATATRNELMQLSMPAQQKQQQ